MGVTASDQLQLGETLHCLTMQPPRARDMTGPNLAQEYNKAIVQEYKSTIVQEHKSSIVQYYKSTKV